MSDNDSIMLEILRRIQADIADTKQDIRDLKFRVGQVEGYVASGVAAQQHTNERLDRIDGRVERIERRLDLVEAH
ncbi:MAG: hypothetical protein PGN09_04905 [Sphingomonas fennica]